MSSIESLEDSGLMRKLPYFDFISAFDEFGFEFDDLASEGFTGFLEETYLDNFIQMRRNFIMENYARVRFYAHKFKGAFQLFKSKYVTDSCCLLQFSIDQKMGIEDLSDRYTEVVFRMTQVLNEIIELARNLKLKINKEKLSLFWRQNGKCDILEDKRIQVNLAKLSSECISTYEGNSTASDVSNSADITFTSTASAGSYCNICVIF